jgi:flagella basal body P-ring formation protein FlgA
MAPLVRAGDRVHLWSFDANVRLEMEVVALEYGRVGQVIHLRRSGQNTLIAGVVVGKDSVELMP